MTRTRPARRTVTALAAAAVAVVLAACSSGSHGPTLAADAPLPTTVPPGTSLALASAQGTQDLQLKLSGQAASLPFTVSSWANLAQGPDIINAFRSHSLDLAINAGIPPIQSHFQGEDAKIVAVNLTRKPSYVFATKPHSDIRTLADFKGKKLAFSQGQAQGVVLLRALKEAGLDPKKDVTLVPLTGGQFLTALQAGQVDIAPLAISQVPSYLGQYGKDGAHTIDTDVVDLLNVLWAPAAVLADPAKAAAIAAYIPAWAKATTWQYEHPDQWNDEYYVKSQGLTADQGRGIIALSNKPLLPSSWAEAIKWEQETVDLLAAGGFVTGFKADDLFDHRFEPLAAAAVTDEYRS
ncbi:ABC transporter substrate-binding protein [Nocardia stercoris]|uniref:ABC transporter substrate-binding protein n=1 Tax=Nocardia stercoris TaxID=2483361 RepID=A0A3M2L1G2_9NOCA|nr:ABC transporter substrate-binding protein [Nocardia stercoris]RMI31487.1 ABC transporter substrate-binding protein [Nocardia stercoris]